MADNDQELQEKLVIAEAKLAATEKDLKTAEEDLETAEKELEVTRQALAKAQLDDLTTKGTIAQHEQQMESDKAAAEEAKANLERQLHAAQEANEAVKAAAEEAKATLEAQVADLGTQLKTAAADLATAQKYAQTVSQEAEKAEQEASKSLQELSENSGARIRELEEKLAALEGQKSKLNDFLQDARGALIDVLIHNFGVNADQINSSDELPTLVGMVVKYVTTANGNAQQLEESLTEDLRAFLAKGSATFPVTLGNDFDAKDKSWRELLDNLKDDFAKVKVRYLEGKRKALDLVQGLNPETEMKITTSLPQLLGALTSEIDRLQNEVARLQEEARAPLQQPATFDPFAVVSGEEEDVIVEEQEGDGSSAAPAHAFKSFDASFQNDQTYKTHREIDSVSGRVQLTYFDVPATISALKRKLVAVVNAKVQAAGGAFVEITLDDFNHSLTNGQYPEYREMLETAQAEMDKFNAETQRLRDELAHPHKDMEPGNVQAIAEAQRVMIEEIAAVLSRPIDDVQNPQADVEQKESEIKDATETFKKAYNDNFPQIKGDRAKSIGWGVGVGLATAALGAGLAFLAFFALPFVGLDIALFTGVFYITLGSAAGALGLGGGVGSFVSALKNRYARGEHTTRGAVSNEKEAAKSTAMILNGLDFDGIREATKKMGVVEPAALPKRKGEYHELDQDEEGKKSTERPDNAGGDEVREVESLGQRFGTSARSMWNSAKTSAQETWEELRGPSKSKASAAGAGEGAEGPDGAAAGAHQFD